MTALWPASLPQIAVRGGASETVQRPKFSFSPEVGPPIQRRKGTVKSSTFQINMVMTTAQVAIFEGFVDDTLSGGVLPFFLPHPRTRSQVTGLFVSDDNHSVDEVSPGKYSVRFQLLVQS